MTQPKTDVEKEALDQFGQFVVHALRDKQLSHIDMLLEGRLRGQARQALQERVAGLTPEQKELLREVVALALDTTLHDLLFAIQEAHDLDQGIEVLARGFNVAALSGELQGEPLGPSGWVRRFSRYPNM